METEFNKPKQFEVSLHGNGTQAQIVASLKAIESQIENTPVKLTRVMARHITQALRIAHNTGANLECQDLIRAHHLPLDYCPICLQVTPTIRTAKYCRCVYCNHNRQQDITTSISGDTLKGCIAEIQAD